MVNADDDIPSMEEVVANKVEHGRTERTKPPSVETKQKKEQKGAQLIHETLTHSSVC
jgi:hypothetical protein